MMMMMMMMMMVLLVVVVADPAKGHLSTTFHSQIIIGTLSQAVGSQETQTLVHVHQVYYKFQHWLFCKGRNEKG